MREREREILTFTWSSWSVVLSNSVAISAATANILRIANWTTRSSTGASSLLIIPTLGLFQRSRFRRCRCFDLGLNGGGRSSRCFILLLCLFGSRLLLLFRFSRDYRSGCIARIVVQAKQLVPVGHSNAVRVVHGAVCAGGRRVYRRMLEIGADFRLKERARIRRSIVFVLPSLCVVGRRRLWWCWCVCGVDCHCVRECELELR